MLYFFRPQAASAAASGAFTGSGALAAAGAASYSASAAFAASGALAAAGTSSYGASASLTGSGTFAARQAGPDFASDHFTASPGDPVEAHPDDLGNTYTRSTYWGPIADTLIRTAEGMTVDSSASSAHMVVMNDAVSPSGDVDYSFDFTPKTALRDTDLFRFLYRAWDANRSGYCVEISPTRVLLGVMPYSYYAVGTVVGTPLTVALTPGTTYHFAGSVRGDYHTLTVSGVGTVSGTDAAIATTAVNNQVGFFSQAELYTAAEGYRVKNFRAGVAAPGAAAGFSGSGAFAASGTASYAAPGSFAGSGSFAASGTSSYAASAGFSGSGALAASGVASVPSESGHPWVPFVLLLQSRAAAGLSASASFSGSGALAASGVASYTAAASFHGAGALAAAGSFAGAGTAAAAFGGSGVFSASGTPSYSAAAGFAASGAFAASGFVSSAASASFSGSGALAASGAASYAAASAFAGSGVFAASGSGAAPGPPEPGHPWVPFVLLLRGQALGTPADPGTLAGDFWTRFVDWWHADPSLSAAIPGGLVAASVAPLQTFPFARMTQVEPQQPLSEDDWPMQSTVSVYAAGREAAWSFARLVVARLEDPQRPPLTYGVWRESSRITAGQIDVSFVNRGPDGDDVYRADVPYDFHVVRFG